MMNITEVRIKIVDEQGHDRLLLGYATITLDCGFVIRDFRIIRGAGGIFISMPSRKVMDHCPCCHKRNHVQARFCNECGKQLKENRAQRDPATGQLRLYVDVAHPISQTFRTLVTDAILAVYDRELQLSKQPGYVYHYDVVTSALCLSACASDTPPSNPVTTVDEFGAGILQTS